MIREDKLEDLFTAIITTLIIKGICTREEFESAVEVAECVRKERQNEAR